VPSTPRSKWQRTTAGRRQPPAPTSVGATVPVAGAAAVLQCAATGVPFCRWQGRTAAWGRDGKCVRGYSPDSRTEAAAAHTAPSPPHTHHRCKCNANSVSCSPQSLFTRFIIRFFQLIFSVEIIFFSHNKSANSVYQPAYQPSRTELCGEHHQRFSAEASRHASTDEPQCTVVR
jgi:hypothetical protein